jgi:hypothetical protein
MDFGAALRASAISELRFSIRYWSRGAILGYSDLASWAIAYRAVAITTTNAILFSANAPIFFFACMDVSPKSKSENMLISTYTAKQYLARYVDINIILIYANG